jgi:DNA-binding XRE family transcriptional regulator
MHTGKEILVCTSYTIQKEINSTQAKHLNVKNNICKTFRKNLGDLFIKSSQGRIS